MRRDTLPRAMCSIDVRQSSSLCAVSFGRRQGNGMDDVENSVGSGREKKMDMRWSDSSSLARLCYAFFVFYLQPMPLPSSWANKTVYIAIYF